MTTYKRLDLLFGKRGINSNRIETFYDKLSI